MSTKVGGNKFGTRQRDHQRTSLGLAGAGDERRAGRLEMAGQATSQPRSPPFESLVKEGHAGAPIDERAERR